MGVVSVYKIFLSSIKISGKVFLVSRIYDSLLS